MIPFRIPAVCRVGIVSSTQTGPLSGLFVPVLNPGQMPNNHLPGPTTPAARIDNQPGLFQVRDRARDRLAIKPGLIDDLLTAHKRLTGRIGMISQRQQHRLVPRPEILRPSHTQGRTQCIKTHAALRPIRR
jgi:hypothetical protein